MEQEKQITQVDNVQNFDYSYIKEALPLKDVLEELDASVKDLNTAAFTSTFDIQQGMILGYNSLMTLVEAIIDSLEEKSPDPENDILITKFYNLYEGLEQLKGKCDYI